MEVSLIYLILFVIGIVSLALGIIKKKRKLKIISAVCLILLILLGIMFMVLLSISNM